MACVPGFVYLKISRYNASEAFLNRAGLEPAPCILALSEIVKYSKSGYFKKIIHYLKFTFGIVRGGF
jgi:hypothetical protein